MFILILLFLHYYFIYLLILLSLGYKKDVVFAGKNIGSTLIFSNNYLTFSVLWVLGPSHKSKHLSF